MKKKELLLIIVLFIFVFIMDLSANADEPMTVDRIIAECAQAMGGKDKIDSVKTIRFEAEFEAHDHPVIIVIQRPNLMRNRALVFDGKRAADLKPKPAKDGKPQGPKLEKKEYWPHFEIDIAFTFPAFFDYPAQYKGLVVEEGRKAYKLVVTMPLGVPMTYFLDAKTFLPFKVFATVMEGGKTYHPERIFSDYKETDGILYPSSLLFRWGTEPRKKGTIKKIVFNPALEDDYFKLPDNL